MKKFYIITLFILSFFVFTSANIEIQPSKIYCGSKFTLLINLTDYGISIAGTSTPYLKSYNENINIISYQFKYRKNKLFLSIEMQIFSNNSINLSDVSLIDGDNVYTFSSISIPIKKLESNVFSIPKDNFFQKRLYINILISLFLITIIIFFIFFILKFAIDNIKSKNRYNISKKAFYGKKENLVRLINKIRLDINDCINFKKDILVFLDEWNLFFTCFQNSCKLDGLQEDAQSIRNLIYSSPSFLYDNFKDFIDSKLLEIEKKLKDVNYQNAQ